MLDTVKPTSIAIYIISGSFHCISVDPEGATQPRTGGPEPLYRICDRCNYVLERSSEYTVRVP